MSLAMSAAEFSKLTRTLYQVLRTNDDYVDEIPTWSFLQFFSYLTYGSSIDSVVVERRIFPDLKKYLPNKVLREWTDILREQRAKTMLDENVATQDEKITTMQKLIMEGSLKEDV